MPVSQKKLAHSMKLFIPSHNRPKSLPNNEKQLLPLKMSEHEVPAVGEAKSRWGEPMPPDGEKKPSNTTNNNNQNMRSEPD